MGKSDPYAGLRTSHEPLDPTMRINSNLRQIPLLNPKGASFRVYPSDGGKVVVLVDVEGHPLHGQTMLLDREVAVRLAQSLMQVVQGNSGGNPGIILDRAGNSVRPGLLQPGL